jgi:hypothetical protein
MYGPKIGMLFDSEEGTLASLLSPLSFLKAQEARSVIKLLQLE